MDPFELNVVKKTSFQFEEIEDDLDPDVLQCPIPEHYV